MNNPNSYIYFFKRDYFNTKITHLMDIFCNHFVEDYPFGEHLNATDYYNMVIGDKKLSWSHDFNWFSNRYDEFIEQENKYDIR